MSYILVYLYLNHVSYSTVKSIETSRSVVHDITRDIAGVGMAHDIKSPKNHP